MSLYCALIVSALITAVLSGSCPPTLSVDQCAPTCGPDTPCEGNKLCCPTECGGALCVDPVTQRRFVTLVKPGSCPDEPGGAWICSHTCTGDSDCPRALKCCRNRCGALACQKAQHNQPSGEPPLFF